MNYYDILGVKSNATQSEIKNAYKKSVIKNHPDRGGDPAKFKQITEAYEVLKDPDKKQYYDTYGSMKNYRNPSMDDIFWNPFTYRKHVNPGQTIQIKLGITEKELFLGCTKKLKVKRKVRCYECEGQGGEYHKCTYCNGSGMVTETIQYGPNTIMQSSKPCNHCNGTGKEYTKKCKTCGGSGLLDKEEVISVYFNSGVLQGEYQTLKQKGFESTDKNSPNGDLIVIPYYKFSENYKYDGKDFYQILDIPYYNCILGTTLEITLVDGNKIKIDIPTNTKELDSIKLDYHGIKNGAYYILIHIIFPKPTNKEIELLKKIQNLHK